jgi:hypothetical protein
MSPESDALRDIAGAIRDVGFAVDLLAIMIFIGSIFQGCMR